MSGLEEVIEDALVNIPGSQSIVVVDGVRAGVQLLKGLIQLDERRE